VKQGDSKASLLQEFSVLEGTICGWLKDEDEADGKIGHDRKKKPDVVMQVMLTKVCTHGLYRNAMKVCQYLQNSS
jgi:hypothetical protein